MWSKKGVLEEIDMDFLIRFALDTKLLKEKKYFTKKDFVFGLANRLSNDECDFVSDLYKNGWGAKQVAHKFILEKNPTASLVSNKFVRYLTFKKYEHVLNNIIFKEFLIGKHRTDINLINGVSYVYEIKTARDKIEKAIPQTKNFINAFEYVYLITHNMEVVPKNIHENVGIIVMDYDDGEIIFEEKIKAIKNTNFDNNLQLNSLRKEEIIAIHGNAKNKSDKNKMINEIMDTETNSNINKFFKKTLKERFRPMWYNYIKNNILTENR